MASNRNCYQFPFRLSHVLVFLMAAILWTLARAEDGDTKSSVDRGKRAPQLYNFGLGKKSYHLPAESESIGSEELLAENGNMKRGEHRFGFGLGKRYDQRFSFGLGKRDPSGRYSFGLGKREPNRFAFGLGKRGNGDDYDDYMKRRFSFGLGKRATDQRFAFGLGKRPDHRFAFGLGKRPDQRFAFGLGKRPDQRFAFGLGKRPENRFSFGLGRRRRSSLESDYSNEEEDFIEKK